MTDTEKSAPIRRRQQQRSIDTRLKITRAALAQFALLGFDGASTRGIALAAAVPHSLVLHHYKSKTELWYETVSSIIAVYRERMVDDAGLQEQSAADRLRHFLADYIRFSAAYPDFFCMMTQENLRKSDRLRWLVEHHVGKVAAHLTALIAQAQANGTFVAGDPLQLMYVFLGSATSPYRSAAEIELLTGQSAGDPARVEQHIQICLSLFMRDRKD